MARGRKPGGQPGNTNALKHGFYSRQFQEMEVYDLETLLARGLENEINMLRVITRRVFSLMADVDSLDEAIQMLEVLGLASTRLAMLLRTQKVVENGDDEFYNQIKKALDIVTKEKGLKR
jgi:hypothetical protein